MLRSFPRQLPTAPAASSGDSAPAPAPPERPSFGDYVVMTEQGANSAAQIWEVNDCGLADPEPFNVSGSLPGQHPCIWLRWGHENPESKPPKILGH